MKRQTLLWTWFLFASCGNFSYAADFSETIVDVENLDGDFKTIIKSNLVGQDEPTNIFRAEIEDTIQQQAHYYSLTLESNQALSFIVERGVGEVVDKGRLHLRLLDDATGEEIPQVDPQGKQRYDRYPDSKIVSGEVEVDDGIHGFRWKPTGSSSLLEKSRRYIIEVSRDATVGLGVKYQLTVVKGGDIEVESSEGAQPQPLRGMMNVVGISEAGHAKQTFRWEPSEEIQKGQWVAVEVFQYKEPDLASTWAPDYLPLELTLLVKGNGEDEKSFRKQDHGLKLAFPYDSNLDYRVVVEGLKLQGTDIVPLGYVLSIHKPLREASAYRGNDGMSDDDKDGKTNLQEYLLGMDPTDYYNGVAPHLEIVMGDNQQVKMNQFAEQPLTIRARDGRTEELLIGAPILFKLIGQGEYGQTGFNPGGGLASTPDPQMVKDSIKWVYTGPDGIAAVYVYLTPFPKEERVVTVGKDVPSFMVTFHLINTAEKNRPKNLVARWLPTSYPAIQLAWADFSGKEGISFKIERKSSDEDWKEIVTINVEERFDSKIVTYLDKSNLISGKSYTYRVKQVGEASSEESEEAGVSKLEHFTEGHVAFMACYSDLPGVGFNDPQKKGSLRKGVQEVLDTWSDLFWASYEGEIVLVDLSMVDLQGPLGTGGGVYVYNLSIQNNQALLKKRFSSDVYDQLVQAAEKRAKKDEVDPIRLPPSLANHLMKIDTDSQNADIQVKIESSFYESDSLDFRATVSQEIGHGMGFGGWVENPSQRLYI